MARSSRQSLLPSILSARLFTGRSQRFHPLLLPAYTSKDLDRMAKQYGLRRDQLKTVPQMIRIWQDNAQKMLNTLASRDGIIPPKIEVSQNAGVWIGDGMSPGYYNRHGNNGHGVIAIEPTAFTVGRMRNGCKTHISTILHEYRHHWQYETYGRKKIDEVYNTEGSVDWSRHKFERDAEDYARKHCKEWR